MKLGNAKIKKIPLKELLLVIIISPAFKKPAASSHTCHYNKQAAGGSLTPWITAAHGQWAADVFTFKGLSSTELIASFTSPHSHQKQPPEKKTYSMLAPTSRHRLSKWDSGVQLWYQYSTPEALSGRSRNQLLFLSRLVMISLKNWNKVFRMSHISSEQRSLRDVLHALLCLVSVN